MDCLFDIESGDWHDTSGRNIFHDSTIIRYLFRMFRSAQIKLFCYVTYLFLN